jgi:hypothetical protein
MLNLLKLYCLNLHKKGFFYLIIVESLGNFRFQLFTKFLDVELINLCSYSLIHQMYAAQQVGEGVFLIKITRRLGIAYLGEGGPK